MDVEHTRASIEQTQTDIEQTRAAIQQTRAASESTRPLMEPTARIVADEIDPKLLAMFKLGALISAVLVLAAGSLAAIGWAFAIEPLKHPTDEPSLQAAASLHFIILSVSLLLLSIGSPRLWRSVSGRILAGIVMVASTVTFIEHTCHIYIKDFVVRQPDEGFALTYPGPLLPHESLAFFVLALGALLLNVVVRRRLSLSQVCAALVFVPNFIVLSCYLFGQSHICVYFGCVLLSPITSLVFLLQSIGLFLSNAESSPARMLSLKGTAGVLARRSCAAVAIVILLLLPRQWLISAGEAAQIVDASTVNIGTAVVAVLALCVFGWLCFRRIESEETQKQEAIEEKVQAIESLKRSGGYAAFKMVCLTCGAEFTGSETVCPNDQEKLVRVMDNLKPGTIFEQRYNILKELGSGGMSTVYLAEHLLMKKMVAVKLLKTQFSSDTTSLRRFQRESQAASSLSHPNIVGIYDFSVSASGQAYMVMEFVEGQSLGDLLKERKTIPWQEAIELFLDICEGLEHAHSKGIIHRDLKPGNIMLLPPTTSDKNFAPKIVDFGLAKVCDQPELNLTQTGEVFGSPLYMSPEQWQGQHIDLRSDIYAMGCVMYDVLTGNPPFSGANSLETMMMHMNAPVPAMAADLHVPPWLEKIIRKAMAKDPEKRFETVSELKKAIADGDTTV
jgi:tRNA A-37 threonylcarbamoyl transferase component Bud32